MDWYLKVVRDNYANFKGRAQRKEYWMFVLFNILILLALNILETIMNLQISDDGGLLSFLYGLAILIPSLAVGVRRLHDTGKVGWWILIALVPFIGWLILLFFYLQDSTPGENKYGPNPKGVVYADALQASPSATEQAEPNEAQNPQQEQ